MNYFAATMVAIAAMGITSGSAAAGGLLAVDFNAGNFNPASMTMISNSYWPLSPDSNTRTFTYVGETDDE